MSYHSRLRDEVSPTQGNPSQRYLVHQHTGSASIKSVALDDIQGFKLSRGDLFISKEQSIRTGKQSDHFLIKPPLPYTSPSISERKTVNQIDKNILGLHFSSCYLNYEDFYNIYATS